jgi:hypothetical protein
MSKTQVIKVTLTTGKVVLLTQMKISHTETAAQQVSAKANGDQNVLQILMQKAILQLLVWQVDGKVLTGAQKEDLDSVFTIGEYGQLCKVLAKVMGGSEVGEPEMSVAFEEAST